jgi:hypothetical protein
LQYVFVCAKCVLLTLKEVSHDQNRNVPDNVLRITAPEKLKADDFHQIAPQVDLLSAGMGRSDCLLMPQHSTAGKISRPLKITLDS